MLDLLKKNGPFYKANLHCHTTVSDGKMTPEQVKHWYASHGYSIVAFTDHSKFRHYPQLCDENFLAIAGVECQYVCRLLPHPHTYRACHMNFWARDPETAVYVPETDLYDLGIINRHIAVMKQNGFLCGLNHPSWSQQPTEDVLSIQGFDTFEIYNNGCQKLCNNGDNRPFYTQFLNSGRRAFAVATDDNHGGFDADGQICVNNDTCGGWINISMPALTYGNFIDAFENGRFYPTTGPEFHALYIDEEADELVVECSPVRMVTVKGIYVSPAARESARDDSVTCARFPLAPIRKMEPMFRVELVTCGGKWASSQPYWFD